MMTKKNYNYKIVLKKGYEIIARALESGQSLNKTKKELTNLVNSFSGITRNERYMIWSEFYKLVRVARHDENWQKKISMRKHYDAVLRACRKADRQKKLRDKRRQVREQLDSTEYIFYMSSVHQKPAEDHKDWQGVIFVDRFWRQKVKGTDYYAVLSYIKNHKTLTVQQIMKEPVYLTTRPNCKHYFIPLDTYTVLHNSQKKLAERHTVKLYTAEEYYDVRRKIFERLDSIVPCKEFKDKQKKIGV